MKLKVNNGLDWITVNTVRRGVYSIVGFGITIPANTQQKKHQLCFTKWDSQVGDLDRGFSDFASCFGGSMLLRWKNVNFNLNTKIIEAPNLKRVREALKHVTFGTWDTNDA